MFEKRLIVLKLIPQEAGDQAHKTKNFMEYIILEKDLLAKLNISRSTLHRYKTQLGFPYIKIGGKSFYNLHEVEAFLREHSSHAHNNAKYARSK